jgi:hypothetical protein
MSSKRYAITLRRFLATISSTEREPPCDMSQVPQVFPGLLTCAPPMSGTALIADIGSICMGSLQKYYRLDESGISILAMAHGDVLLDLQYGVNQTAGREEWLKLSSSNDREVDRHEDLMTTITTPASTFLLLRPLFCSARSRIHLGPLLQDRATDPAARTPMKTAFLAPLGLAARLFNRGESLP